MNVVLVGEKHVGEPEQMSQQQLVQDHHIQTAKNFIDTATGKIRRDHLVFALQKIKRIGIPPIQTDERLFGGLPFLQIFTPPQLTLCRGFEFENIK